MNLRKLIFKISVKTGRKRKNRDIINRGFLPASFQEASQDKPKEKTGVAIILDVPDVSLKVPVVTNTILFERHIHLEHQV